ncbi:MAG: F0F1 ATP synthase subunit B [Tenacibaculum sp.]
MDQLLNDFSPGLFFMQAIIFTILLFLLIKFAWKPIMNAIIAREQGIKKELDAARVAREERQNLQAEIKSMLKEARTERDTMLKEAREIKNQIISKAKEQAKEEAFKLAQNAKAEIQQEKQAALAHIKQQVAELSIGIASQIIRKELTSENKQLKLVEQMLDEVTLN